MITHLSVVLFKTLKLVCSNSWTKPLSIPTALSKRFVCLINFRRSKKCILIWNRNIKQFLIIMWSVIWTVCESFMSSTARNHLFRAMHLPLQGKCEILIQYCIPQNLILSSLVPSCGPANCTAASNCQWSFFKKRQNAWNHQMPRNISKTTTNLLQRSWSMNFSGINRGSVLSMKPKAGCTLLF